MRSTLKIVVFVSAFLVGCLFSFDNPLSLWPTIADINVKNDKKIVCSLGPQRSDGDVSCVCNEVE